MHPHLLLIRHACNEGCVGCLLCLHTMAGGRERFAVLGILILVVQSIVPNFVSELLCLCSAQNKWQWSIPAVIYFGFHWWL